MDNTPQIMNMEQVAAQLKFSSNLAGSKKLTDWKNEPAVTFKKLFPIIKLTSDVLGIG